MDESITLFKQEQDRIENAGGVGQLVKRQLLDTLLGLALVTVVGMLIMAALGSFPRNPDHSIRLVYSGPFLISLGTASGFILYRYRSMPRWIKPALWLMVALPLGIVPVTLFEIAYSSFR
jgi:hypothetical protein